MGCINSVLKRNEQTQDNRLDITNRGERSIISQDLVDINWKDTKPFVVPLSDGIVIKVYDGDTITIANRLPIDNCNDIFRFSVRLNGIDTPEMRGKNEDEKTIAKEAKLALSEKILNKHVTLKNVATEKYGRVLADVYLDDLHLNQWLLDERYAVKYDGGTKISPVSWIKYKKTGDLK